MGHTRGSVRAARVAAWARGSLAVLLLALAGLAIAGPARAATVTCGDPSNTATVVDLSTLSRNPGDDLQVVGNCLVPGGLLSNPSPSYKFGNVNIFSQHPDQCTLDSKLVSDTTKPCGGTLTFKDERIDFWARSIIVERGGALIAGSPTQPIGTTGRGENQSARHVLTITLWGGSAGGGDSLLPSAPGVGCITPATATTTNCGVPTDTWNNGMTTPKPLPGVANPDYFYPYSALPFDSSGYFGNKVLGVAFGGRILLYGKKGATYAGPVSPLDSGKSWARLAGDLAVNGTEVKLDRAVDWEAGDAVVVSGTDYLPRHFELRSIASMTQGGQSFIVGAVKPGNPDYPVGMVYPHKGTRFPLTRVPAALGVDPTLVSNGAETRAAVALLSRSIVIRSGDNDTDLGTTLCANVGCYYGGHTVIRQGVLEAKIQGVEFAQLGQGGRLGRYPIHFHMLRHAPPGTMIADSSINESMTRWITLHATQDVLIARNVGFESIGHGFYLEDGTETDNDFYSNLGISARAAVVGQSDADLQAFRDKPLKRDPNWRKVPGILAQRMQTTAAGYNPPWDGDPQAADRFPFHSDWNHPSIFWVMNAWNDFRGNLASGAGMCGACYWMVPGANSGHSRMMSWVGYASRQKQDAMSNTGPDITRAGSAPLQGFYGNSCSSAEFSFITISATEPCRGLGDVATGHVTPVDNPLAPDTCWVQPPGQPFPSAAQCVRVQPDPNPGLAPADDLGYYPTVSGVGGRFPLQCSDTTKDCGTSPKGSRRCANINKTIQVGGSQVTIPSGDVDPDCTVDVLDHYTTAFNWAPHNFGAMLMRPFWYLVNNSVISDVQNGGVSFVTGGDYTRSSAINGYWSLAEHSIFVGHTQTGNGFAEDDGPFNPASGLKCSAQASNFCLQRDQQWTINFSDWGVNQRLFNIYDGPSYQSRNAYLDITPSYLESTDTSHLCNGDLDCLGQLYPIALGPTNGIMRSPTATGTAAHRCFLPNAAIAWKQSNGFYYPPAFHSSKLFFDKVDIRHFVVEPVFTGNGYTTDETKANEIYCKRPLQTGIFNNFSDVDRQTVLNDDDGSLTGLVHTLSVNKISPFFNAPYETDECAAQTGVTNLTPIPPAPQPTAKTSPYDYVTSVVLPGCTQLPPSVPNQPQSICGCDTGGNNCSEWAKECANGQCSGVKLYRQLKTSTGESPPYIRMAGQSTWQRSTLTANNGTYYIDSTYTHAQQNADGFVDPPNGFLNMFVGGRDYYVFLVYAQGTTKQDYKVYVGGTDVKKGTADTCSAGATQPAPYLIRTDISTAPFKVTPKPGDPPKWTMPWKWCYNETGSEPGVLTVHVDMTSFAAELAPQPNTTYNAICQPKTFCSVSSKGICGCAAKNPMSNDPASKQDCDEICGTWAVKDLDCPSGGCIGFGFKLPTGFNPALGQRPGAGCFLSTDTRWNKGFTKMISANGLPGAQCTYTQSFTGKFCTQ